MKKINNSGAQNNSNNVINNAISQPVKQEVNCDDICPNFYDIVCAVANVYSLFIKCFVFTIFLELLRKYLEIRPVYIFLNSKKIKTNFIFKLYIIRHFPFVAAIV